MRTILFTAVLLLGCVSNQEAEYPNYEPQAESDDEEGEEESEYVAEQTEDEATYPDQVEDDQAGCEFSGGCEEDTPSQPEPEYPE